jgi:hypothetical protein
MAIVLPAEHLGLLGALYAKLCYDSAQEAAKRLAERNILVAPNGQLKDFVEEVVAWARHYYYSLPDLGRGDVYHLVETYVDQVKETPGWHGSPEQEICKAVYMNAEAFPVRSIRSGKWKMIWQEERNLSE